MKILIIEDEQLIANGLISYLKEYDESIEIVDILKNKTQIDNYFSQKDRPDLIFSDIQLEDCLSIEALKEWELSTPIIFCTAFNEFALEAFKVNVIDYILKPFEFDDIVNALEKFKTLTSTNKSTNVELSELLNEIRAKNATSKKRLIVSKGNKLIPIELSDVSIFHLNNGILYARLFSGKDYVINETMNSLEKFIGNDHFRLNRQIFIHKNNVDSIEHYFSRKLLVIPKVEIDEKLIVSKANASSFLQWLEE